jgi:hypothetical protein
MKRIGEYTARGIITEAETEAGTPHRINLFDGTFTTGYRITGFYIWGASYGSSTQPDCIGKLSKNDDGVTSAANFMRADDDNQIAWAFWGATTDSASGGTPPSIIDRDNLVVEDLFVYGRSNSGSTAAINYLVELEKVEISDWQGALAMARDRAQGDL